MVRSTERDDTQLTLRIRQEINRRGWNVRELERRAGLKERAVLSILDRTSKNPRIDTVQKIAAALDLSVAEMLGEKPTITEDTRALVFRLTLEFLKVFRDGEQPVPPDASDYDLEIIAKAFADGALQQKAPDPDKLRQTVKHAIEEVNDLQSLRGR